MKQSVAQYIITPMILSASVFIVGYADIASAKKVPASLGTKATAVDTYRSTCSADKSGPTTQFIARVQTVTKKGPLISVRISKGTKTAKATDPKNGDTTFSPYATIKGSGEGIYNISVDKNGAGIVSYVLQTYCRAANGEKTDQAGPKVVQNQ